MTDAWTNKVIHGDNLPVLRAMPDESVDLIYIDPPFNTGRVQRREQIRTTRDATNGTRNGFGGAKYTSERLGAMGWNDKFDDFRSFLFPRLEEARRVLRTTGTLYLHLDYREVHYARLMLDAIFGDECLLNEIIWAYDYGAKPKNRWPAKHDNILVYVKHPEQYWFDSSAVEREPYMAPGLVSAEKAARGKLPTDVWWHTIVSPTGREKTGYPTQKPLGILKRIITASCPPGGLVLDFFAGSGTTGVAAAELGRRSILVDENPEAITVMKSRFDHLDIRTIFEEPPSAPRALEASSRSAS